MSETALTRLKERFGAAVLEATSFRGDETAVVESARIVDVLGFLRDEPGLAFDQLIDLTCVDLLGLEERPGGRFEVVYHLRSMDTGRRLRIKARIAEGPEGQAPEIASACGLWKGANWPEREAWDMFGVRFVGHPDLRRILMYEEFVGHPLRRDYPKERRQPLVRRDYT